MREKLSIYSGWEEKWFTPYYWGEGKTVGGIFFKLVALRRVNKKF